MARIFLTGAYGMVGHAIRKHQNAPTHEWLVPRRQELDLFDRQAVENYIRKNSPDVVIHAAGRVGGIQANIKEPVSFMLENINMGQNVIMAAAESGISSLINFGSTCMYPADRETPLEEADILTGRLEPTNEGYALAKIVTARLVSYLAITRQINYKTLIPSNLYGPYDSFDPQRSHLIPSIIRKLHQAVTQAQPSVEIWGTGEARREFLFSEDLADAVFMALGDMEKMPSTVNIGLGQDYTITEYYEIAAKIIGYQGHFTFNTAMPSGMKRKLSSINAARAWGWQPKNSIHDGIKKTYDYFLAHEQ